MNLLEKEGDFRKTVQLLCLIFAGILPFFTVAVGNRLPMVGYFLAEQYVTVPTLVFVGTALAQRLSPTAKKSFLLAAAAVIWFVAVQLQHHLNHMGARNFGFYAVAYLLAFPYAAVTEDGQRRTGLNWIGRIYLAFSTFLVICAMMLQMEVLPEFLSTGIYWDGARITLYWHPNGSAFVLLLGMSFSLYFLACTEKRWKKCVLALVTALHFCTMVLTNSRTTIFLGCAILAGTVFFALWRGTWKQFLVAAGAAVLTVAVLLGSYNALFDFHTEVQIEKLMEQREAAEKAKAEKEAAEKLAAAQNETQPAAPAETAPAAPAEAPKSNGSQVLRINQQTGEVSLGGTGSSAQGELSNDIKTLNGRIFIWKAAAESMRDTPSIKLWGTEFISAELGFRAPFTPINAHNAWVQMAMLMGLPGLLIALVYTVIAVWNLWILMWRPGEDLSRKVIAMMVICLLTGSILEAYLFTGEDLSNSENFLFFLCSGYLIQWNRMAKK